MSKEAIIKEIYELLKISNEEELNNLLNSLRKTHPEQNDLIEALEEIKLQYSLG